MCTGGATGGRSIAAASAAIAVVACGNGAVMVGADSVGCAGRIAHNAGGSDGGTAAGAGGAGGVGAGIAVTGAARTSHKDFPPCRWSVRQAAENPAVNDRICTERRSGYCS